MAYDHAVRWPRIGGLLRDDGPMGRSLAAVVLAAAWVATWRPQVDPDAWWHLELGDRILASGALPSVEPFSWLTAGDRFVAHSWLWDVLLAEAWRMAGATGTSLLVLPVTAVVVWLVWELIGLVAPGPALMGRAGLVLFAVVAALPLWAPRAQTLDVAFVLAVVLMLARYLRLGAHRGLISLPVIGLLWANLHGSAVLALVLCVALAAMTLPIGMRWGAWPRRSLRPLVQAGLAGVAATLLNPYGVGLLAYPFERDVASAFSPAISEWRSPDFGAVELLPLRALLIGFLLIAVWYPARARDPFLLLAAGAWTFAALGSVRFVAIAGPLLVIVLAPAVGTAVGRWVGTPTNPAQLGEEPKRTHGRPSRRVGGEPRAAAAIAAVAIAGVLIAGWLIIDPPRQDAAIFRRMPVAAVAAFDAADCPSRILPAYAWAGYFVWATGLKVGAYGNSAEGAVAQQAGLEAVTIDPGRWLDEHAVNLVLLPSDGPLSHWLDESTDWRLAYQDPQATIHVRLDATGCQVTPPA